jgi:uncharacterized protein
LTRIGLISDTHGKLRNTVFAVFADVELILHAGDIGHPDIITELETLAPVRAVHGNTDGLELRSRHPEALAVTVAEKLIRVVHGHVLGSPTPASLRAQNPDADVIVYGHTHMPLLDKALPLVVNPGAAGPARFKLKPSVAILTVPDLEVVFIDL